MQRLVVVFPCLSLGESERVTLNSIQAQVGFDFPLSVVLVSKEAPLDHLHTGLDIEYVADLGLGVYFALNRGLEYAASKFAQEELIFTFISSGAKYVGDSALASLTAPVGAAEGSAFAFARWRQWAHGGFEDYKLLGLEKYTHYLYRQPINIESLAFKHVPGGRLILFDVRYKIGADFKFTNELFFRLPFRKINDVLVELPEPGLSAKYAELGGQEVRAIRREISGSYRGNLFFYIVAALVAIKKALERARSVGGKLLHLRPCRKV